MKAVGIGARFVWLLLAGLIASVGTAATPAVAAQEEPSSGAAPPAIFQGQPLTLAEAVGTALQRSPRLTAAAATADAARFRRSGAVRASFPTVNLEGSYLGTPSQGRRLIPGAGLDAGNRALEDLFSENIASARVGLTVPVYTGGFISSRRRRASSEVDLAAADRGATQDDLALELAATYYGALAFEDAVAATRASVEALDEASRVSAARLRAGRAAPVEVLRIRSRLEIVRERLASTENDHRLALERLETLMGVRVPVGTVALADTLAVSPPQVELEAAIQQALERRPEVRAANARVGIADADIGIARSAYIPQVVAGVGWEVAQDLDRLGDRALESNPFVTVGLSVPLFDPGIAPRLDEASARRRQVEADREDVRLAVALEVETAFLRLEEAAERVDAAVASVAAATEALRLERVRFEAGRATVTELLDAQAEELNARVTLAAARADHETSRLAFLRASASFPEDPAELVAFFERGAPSP